MKLFITGATGYIGYKLTVAAVKKGHQVHALTRHITDSKLYRHPGVRYFQGDVTDFDSIVEAMKGCDAIFHAAALTQLWHSDRSMFYKINVGGTKNVMEAALYHDVKKVVFTSSCAVLGPSHRYPVAEDDPRIAAFENDYEISKHCAEELVKEYAHKGLPAVIVSPPRVYGPGLWTKGNPINRLIRTMLKHKVAFVPGAEEVVGNYAFIDDVVEGHFLAMDKGVSGEKYILGGENISYGEFFRSIRQMAGQRIKLIAVPRFLLKVGCALVYAAHRLVRRHTHFTPKVVDRLFQNRAVSCEKAIRHLGYRVTPFREGLLRTIHFLKAEQYV